MGCQNYKTESSVGQTQSDSIATPSMGSHSVAKGHNGINMSDTTEVKAVKIYKGHCSCNAVQLSFKEQKPIFVGFCHCTKCRVLYGILLGCVPLRMLVCSCVCVCLWRKIIIDDLASLHLSDSWFQTASDRNHSELFIWSPTVSYPLDPLDWQSTRSQRVCYSSWCVRWILPRLLWSKAKKKDCVSVSFLMCSMDINLPRLLWIKRKAKERCILKLFLLSLVIVSHFTRLFKSCL